MDVGYLFTAAPAKHSHCSLPLMRVISTSKEWWLHRCRRAERGYSTFKVRRGGDEEILLIQGKEQQLCFAGAAVKRYPMTKGRETQVIR